MQRLIVFTIYSLSLFCSSFSFMFLSLIFEFVIKRIFLFIIDVQHHPFHHDHLKDHHFHNGIKFYQHIIYSIDIVFLFSLCIKTTKSISFLLPFVSIYLYYYSFLRRFLFFIDHCTTYSLMFIDCKFLFR